MYVKSDRRERAVEGEQVHIISFSYFQFLFVCVAMANVSVCICDDEGHYDDALA